jgi:carbon-monoxide dehydrogenase medium subunit
MIPSSFDYAAPETLSDALKLLSADPASKVLAGGQSLIPLLKLRLGSATQLVDLGRIASLHFISEVDGGIAIGAMTTHHQIETSELLREKCPLLAEAASHIGDVQVRNRGTIGGSLAHADPAADYPAALLALEAKVKIAGPGGERTIGIEEFLVDALTTALEPGEIVSEIHVPIEPAGTGVSYQTQIQLASGFAIVGAAARVTVKGGKVATARVGVTGIASKPYRATAVEDALEGKDVGAESIAAAAAHAADGVEALADLHASAEYRAHVAAVYVRRALEAAAGQAR